MSQRARVGYPEGTLSHQSYPEKEGDEEGGEGRDKERERERALFSEQQNCGTGSPGGEVGLTQAYPEHQS